MLIKRTLFQVIESKPAVNIRDLFVNAVALNKIIATDITGRNYRLCGLIEIWKNSIWVRQLVDVEYPLQKWLGGLHDIDELEK